jgi:hypothetical protein
MTVSIRAIRLLVGAALATALAAVPAIGAVAPIAVAPPPVGIPVAAAGPARANPPPPVVAWASVGIPATGPARADTQPTAAGQLAAQGSGIVSLQGKLIAYGRILGPGLIVIRDPGGDAVVRVNGRLRRIPRSGVLRVSLASASADGSPFFIHDPSGLQLRIMAVVLDVAAAGHGRATLDGDGNYSVNGSQTTQSWSEAQAPLDLEAAATQ